MKRKASPTSQMQLQVGDMTITYSLTFSDRRSVGITIRPNKQVDVRAPHGSNQEFVTEVVQKHATWIQRQLQKFSQKPPASALPKKPETPSYQFLGREIPLKVEKVTTSSLEGVCHEENKIGVKVKEPQNQARIAALLERWSCEQAAQVFLVRMLALFPRFNGLPLQPPLITVRRMRARWGSCSTKGTITLNLKLIHFDESLIDYVIMHELCHLIEHNHSKHYYALLSRMMPDWKERRQRLNDFGMPD